MPDQLSIFSVGNGDSVLLEYQNTVVMTDMNYRSGASDEIQDDKPDFIEEIRDACLNDQLDLFVCTHPDLDHVRGADAIFHLGPPEDWVADPDVGDPLILINEIWCSPYAINAYEGGDAEKPLIDEIKRRYSLLETSAADTPGNILKVRCCEDDEVSGVIGELTWQILAPTRGEASIPNDGTVSSNDTSLAIRWTTSRATKIMILGDATVSVLDRLGSEVLEQNPEFLQWHILIAPHHCSRRSLGYIDPASYGSDEEFIDSPPAIAALSEQLQQGFIVSSSRKFSRVGSPPSIYARNRYYKILHRTDSLNNVSDQSKERFLVTGGKQDDPPEHVIFDLGGSIPGLRGSRKQNRGPAVASAAGAGGSYG